MVRDSSGLTKVERLERQAPPPHPSPLKGEGVGGGVGLAADAQQRREAAEWVRLNLPDCSAFAAEVKAAFGEARMTFASENGHVVGKPTPPAAFSVTGDALTVGMAMKKAKA